MEVNSISSKSRLEVCTRAADRRQLAGCNRFLLGDALSGKRFLNKAYVAHIVVEEPNGPGGDTVLSPPLADEPANLMPSGASAQQRRRHGVPGFPKFEGKDQ